MTQTMFGKEKVNHTLMQVSAHDSGQFDWADFSDEDQYQTWRAAKIRAAKAHRNARPVVVDSLNSPDPDAISEIRDRARTTNFALYQVADPIIHLERNMEALVCFSRALGFAIPEHHRSAEESGVVALRQSDAPNKRDFIPYSSRRMNWHTDGYYNAEEARVAGFILHCHQEAKSGGANQIIDPEIAYIRMRDENPALVQALMADDAMIIPENTEADGAVRPASVGPVFYADPSTGRLQMRYTARTRSVFWSDDPLVQQAQTWLRRWLAEGEPLGLDIRLLRGQGLVCNNVLHNRSGFDDDAEGADQRTMLRVRFLQRVAEE